MTALWQNLDYAAALVLFGIGLHSVVTARHLIRKVIALNIMETAVFAVIVTAGMVDGGDAPILGPGAQPPFASPIPHALVLTAIVVVVSTTALALGLILRIHRQCGTLDADALRELD